MKDTPLSYYTILYFLVAVLLVWGTRRLTQYRIALHVSRKDITRCIDHDAEGADIYPVSGATLTNLAIQTPQPSRSHCIMPMFFDHVLLMSYFDKSCIYVMTPLCRVMSYLDELTNGPIVIYYLHSIKYVLCSYINVLPFQTCVNHTTIYEVLHRASQCKLSTHYVCSLNRIVIKLECMNNRIVTVPTLQGSATSYDVVMGPFTDSDESSGADTSSISTHLQGHLYDLPTTRRGGCSTLQISFRWMDSGLQNLVKRSLSYVHTQYALRLISCTLTFSLCVCESEILSTSIYEDISVNVKAYFYPILSVLLRILQDLKNISTGDMYVSNLIFLCVASRQKMILETKFATHCQLILECYVQYTLILTISDLGRRRVRSIVDSSRWYPWCPLSSIEGATYRIHSYYCILISNGYKYTFVLFYRYACHIVWCNSNMRLRPRQPCSVVVAASERSISLICVHVSGDSRYIHPEFWILIFVMIDICTYLRAAKHATVSRLRFLLANATSEWEYVSCHHAALSDINNMPAVPKTCITDRRTQNIPMFTYISYFCRYFVDNGFSWNPHHHPEETVRTSAEQHTRSMSRPSSKCENYEQCDRTYVYLRCAWNRMSMMVLPLSTRRDSIVHFEEFIFSIKCCFSVLVDVQMFPLDVRFSFTSQYRAVFKNTLYLMRLRMLRHPILTLHEKYNYIK